jgi:hypothetical protein
MERTQVLFCEGCGCDSDDEARGWEAHLALDEDGSTTVVILPHLLGRGVGQRQRLAEGLDDVDQFVEAVAVTACELDEVAGSFDDRALLGCADHGDATPAAELEQAFVAEQPERTQDGVRVHTEDGGEVLGGREALARLGFSVGDRPPDLTGDLLEEIGAIASVELDIQHDASNTSANKSGRQP